MEPFPPRLAMLALDAGEFKDSSVALREGPVHLLHCEVLELPMLIAVGTRNFVEAIPFLIKLVWKFLFVLPCFFLDIKLERCNYFFLCSIVSRKSVNESPDS